MREVAEELGNAAAVVRYVWASAPRQDSVIGRTEPDDAAARQTQSSSQTGADPPPYRRQEGRVRIMIDVEKMLLVSRAVD
jgi:hypothetical protein